MAKLKRFNPLNSFLPYAQAIKKGAENIGNVGTRLYDYGMSIGNRLPKKETQLISPISDYTQQGLIDARFGLTDPAAQNAFGYSGGQTIGQLEAQNKALTKAYADMASGAGSAQMLGSIVFNGQVFNLDDPAQFQAYTQARLSMLDQMKSQYLADLETEAQKGAKGAGEQYAQELAKIDQEIQNTQDDARAYLDQFNKNVTDLGQQNDLQQVQIQNRFASMSPQAFQSSQATLGNYANDLYLQGVADQTAAASAALGEGYIQGGELGGQLGGQLSSLRGARGNLESGYQNYLTGDLAGSVASKQNEINDWYNQQKQDFGNEVIGYNPKFDFNAFNFQREGSQRVAPNMVDINRFTPFTDASKLTAANTAYTAPVRATKTNVNALDTYLNRFNETNKSKIKQYLGSR